MFISVDTISLVQNCKLPSSSKNLAVSKKPHKFGQKWVFKNTKDVIEPRIEIYPDYRRSHWLRVDLELSKLAYGNNIRLLDTKSIENALEQISDNIEKRTTIPFDAQNVSMSRIDYATNHYVSSPSKFLQRYFDYKVNRLTRHIVGSSTVYFENTQQALAMYDKYIKSAKDRSISKEELEYAKGLIRLEYRFKSKTAVNRLVGKLDLAENLAKYLLHPSTIKQVVNEMNEILNIHKFNDSNYPPIRIAYEQTGSIKKAMQLVSFADAYKEFGEDFYLKDELDFSKTSYDRKIKEIQESGAGIIISSKAPSLVKNPKRNSKKLCRSTETSTGQPCRSLTNTGQERCFRHQKNNKQKTKSTDSTLLQNIAISSTSDEDYNAESILRENFLKSYEKHYGNVTKTCKEVGIHRTTFYNWKKSSRKIDIEFVKKFHLIKPKEKLLDIAEHRVMSEIINLNSPQGAKLALHLLKTKGKSRGYG